MKKITLLIITLTALLSSTTLAAKAPLAEELEDSLVYIRIASQGYNNYMPWKKKQVRNSVYYGCAVGEKQILTTAEAAIDATYIKVKTHSQNEFVTAKIKSLDYSLNLCLLELADEMETPLKAVKFGEYKEGSQLNSYWLDSEGQVTTGRAYMDRAQVSWSETLHTRNLELVGASTSQEAGWGELYCDNKTPIGIASWYDSDDKESGIIPGETINKFIKAANNGEYKGFGMIGFKTADLTDPDRRRFLKLPQDEKDGVLIVSTRTIGTGCDELQKNDVLKSIDGHIINAYGNIEHPLYENINFEYLITSKPLGSEIVFEIYREGQKKTITAKSQNFSADEMCIPYHTRNIQPDYLVRGGYIFQKLTRKYLSMWGDNWSGKVPPYLYNLYKKTSYKPTPERKDIIILSQVIPADINLGYQKLKRIVVKRINGHDISSMEDVFAAFETPAENNFDLVEFEMNYPMVVIDRSKLTQADAQISQRYTIPKLSHLNDAKK